MIRLPVMVFLFHMTRLVSSVFLGSLTISVDNTDVESVKPLRFCDGAWAPAFFPPCPTGQ